MSQQSSVSSSYSPSRSVAIVTRDRSRFLVSVTGDLDLASTVSPALSHVVGTYRSEEAVDIDLDLRGVTFMDSAGIRWLIELRAAAVLANRRIRLRHASAAVVATIAAAGLGSVFRVVAPTGEDATGNSGDTETATSVIAEPVGAEA